VDEQLVAEPGLARNEVVVDVDLLAGGEPRHDARGHPGTPSAAVSRGGLSVRESSGSAYSHFSRRNQSPAEIATSAIKPSADG
jgi:hypothetical protein